MQQRSELWKSIVESGDFTMLATAYIQGLRFDMISAPTIERGLMQENLSVGNCSTALLKMSVLPTETESTETLTRRDLPIVDTFVADSMTCAGNGIPRSAKVRITMQVTDGERMSEEIPAGSFYLSRRQRDPVSGLLTIECYDAMLKANAAYTQTGNYPKPMATVVDEIAAALGVELDARTEIQSGEDYMIPLPDANTSMHDVLGGIAGAHGGNWIITPENRLRLIRMNENSGTVAIIGVTERLTVGRTQTITGLRVQTDTGDQMYGTDDGAVVVTSTPYLTHGSAERLTAWLLGMSYQAYALAGAIYDPAAELGDALVSRDDVTGILVSEAATYNLAFRGSLSAPEDTEIEDEYPYIGATAEMQQQIRRLNRIVADSVTTNELEAVTARLDNLSVDDIRAGIIHSADYAYVQIPLLYPAADVYPADDTYASNGEYVTSGFAIDFGTGQIYGGIYSGEMASMKADIETLQEQVLALQNQLTYPKA